nr:histidine-type phosphatase [uncultured Butyrivibrio sp.]
MNAVFTRFKKVLSILLTVIMLLSCVVFTGCGEKTKKPLSEYWTADSAVADSLRDYVSRVIDKKDTEYFIPKEDRIAVFDMDGTLTCETFYTYYDTMMFINYCLIDHPERVSDELKAAAAEIRPGYTAGEELARNFAKAYAGLTINELYDYAVEFGQKQTDSFINMRYIDGFYLPMVEVVKYLYDNDFTVYVVSGTERTTSRAIVANSPIAEYVLPSHVIGTEFEVKVKGNEGVFSNMDYKYADGDELVFTGGFIQKNLNANKTIWIEREIGKYPVLAFGNSGSDTSMMNYALDKRNPYPSKAYMVVADDADREWGKQDFAEKSKDYKQMGYEPVSMRNDFLKIYPDSVKKADQQFVEPKVTEEAKTQEESGSNIIQFPGNTTSSKNVRTTISREGYSLEQVVVLSRHNMRAPLSVEGSQLDTITPNKWFEWSAPTSQLSVRGGNLEVQMGQYFRKWLESEGFFEPNYRPEEGKIRIYANSKQRTIATARFFAAGLLPANDTEIEYHAEFDTMDPVFNPVFTFVSDEYAKAADTEIHAGYDAYIEGLSDNYALLEEVIDVKNSDDFKSGKFTGFVTDDSVFTIEEGKEPSVSGSLNLACKVSDALVLQYYEIADQRDAAFGHDLTDDDWKAICEIKDLYVDCLFASPSVAANLAHPILEEMLKELETEGREFTFLCGHDSNLTPVMSVLGVEDYYLPEAIERTPVGSKIVFCRWKDDAGNEKISIDLVYQKTSQLRGESFLELNNPPGILSLQLEGVKADENGLYEPQDVIDRFNEAIGAYDKLLEEYAQDDAA